MADAKSTDGLFHWNFDLSDNENGFTDITYSPKTDSDPDGQEENLIFVPKAETPRRRENAGAFVERYVDDKAAQYDKAQEPAGLENIAISFTETASDKGGLAAAPIRTGGAAGSSAGTAPTGRSASSGRTGSRQVARRQYASEKNAAYQQNKKPAAAPKKKKKKMAKGAKDGGRRILFFALILLAAVGLTVLAVKLIRGSKSKSWALAEEDSEVMGLMTSYFDCVQNPHANTMRTILDPNAKVNAQTLSMEANIIDSIDELQVYSIRGINKGEYVILACYEITYKNIDTAMPKFEWFYARPDSSGTLRLLTDSEYNASSEAEVSKYMSEVGNLEDIKAICTEVNERYNEAVKQDENLRAFLDQLDNGDYTPWSDGEEETEPATEPEETEPESSESVEDQVCVFVSGDNVRMRATPVDGEVLAQFDKGHYLYVISSEKGSDGYKWYKVSDSLSTNDATGMTQSKTGLSGYIREDFISTTYPQ